ncbi:MAG: UDP-N-acetylmuramoyl-tripeptide--D-alanyl-D-alanine ligase [Oscillospiraceae bacterium]|jgi:UDP-N-acetylmuramoyl-tripeptide--D-alanyl-D-alanine ligase|nr:UDP-N-acetylmuramoyl-tripeptide--D-alanyl-D-alanine ligase [Oscillospiraceae bacterium]
MLPLTVRKIAEVTGGSFVGSAEILDAEITSVVRDNRECVAGSLFLCFVGERADGHDYANAAFDAGAVCAIAERGLADAKGAYIVVDSTAKALQTLGAYYRNLLTIPVIGVVGSVGKTTMKELIAAALGAKFNVWKTPENLNNEIGVPLTLLGTGAEHTAAVVEMGISAFGEMTRLAETARPDYVVFTAVGHCHLDNLINLDGVLRAKAEVFPLMKSGGVAILCGDDEKLRNFDPKIRKITFGAEPHNDYRAENIVTDGTEGVSFALVTPESRVPVSIRAYGSHLAPSAAGAAAVAELLGVPAEEIARGLASYRTIAGRANVIRTESLTIIDDCYNANPNSVAASLRSLAELSGRRVAILGDMNELGRNSNELHRDTGILAGKLGIDVLICCGEKAEFIFKGFIASKSEKKSYHFPFRDAMFERLPGLIKKGDAILVKASHSMQFEEVVTRVRNLRP